MLTSISKVFTKDWTMCMDDSKSKIDSDKSNPFVFVDSPGIN